MFIDNTPMCDICLIPIGWWQYSFNNGNGHGCLKCYQIALREIQPIMNLIESIV